MSDNGSDSTTATTTVVPTASNDNEDELAKRIDETRIIYEDVGHGVRLHGQAFSLEFADPVDPEAFCETICTADDPWRMFGLERKLADERTDTDGNVVASEYWSVAGVLIHVEDGEVVDGSKIDLEITSEWVRVYVKQGCCEQRAAEFVRTVDEEYGVDVQFSGLEKSDGDNE